MHDQGETRSGSRVRPLEHLQVAVGVPERGDRPPSDEGLDADGLALLVVDEADLGQLAELRLAVLHLERELAVGADDLLGRDPVDLLGPRPHELDAPAGDDVGLEPVGSKVREQFEHRLVHHLRVRPSGPGVSRLGDPVGHRLAELLGRHAGVRRRHHLEDPLLAARQSGLQVPFQQGGEGLARLPLGMARRECLDPVDGERELDVHRLLDPERAVVVERGDPLGGRHEVGRSVPGDSVDEGKDGLPGGRVVPRRQRRGRVEGRSRQQRGGEGGCSGGRRGEKRRREEPRSHGQHAEHAPDPTGRSEWRTRSRDPSR
jgi:hypothetical protein